MINWFINQFFICQAGNFLNYYKKTTLSTQIESKERFCKLLLMEVMYLLIFYFSFLAESSKQYFCTESRGGKKIRNLPKRMLVLMLSLCAP